MKSAKIAKFSLAVLIIVLNFSLFAAPVVGEASLTTARKEQLVAMSIDFGDQQPLSIDKIQDLIVSEGYSWSEVFAYSTIGNRIVVVVRDRIPKDGTESESVGAGHLYILLGKLQKTYNFNLESLGLFTLNVLREEE